MWPLNCYLLLASFHGELISFSNLCDDKEHVVLQLGHPGNAPLVRVHSECLTGDVFGSQRCDCGPQLNHSIRTLAKEGGYLVYLRQEGRGIGLYNKIDAYALQDRGYNTYEANQALGFPDDMRDFKVAAEMLKALGVQNIRLLSNNPKKKRELMSNGVLVSEMENTILSINRNNYFYLKTKCTEGGHRIHSAFLKLAHFEPVGL